MKDRLEIATLGGIALRCNGRPVVRLTSRKVKALLIFLACTGKDQPRETLATLFWGDSPQVKAMASLRVALSNLKKNLGTFLTITRTTVGINPAANLWLDVTILESHLESVDRQEEKLTSTIANRIEEGLEIYRGEFLQGFHVSDCREFEDWAAVERRRLMSRVVDALSKLSAWYLERGEYEAGISHARRLTQMEPLLEEAHQLLMQLLAYSGQRSAALGQFETVR